MKTEWWVNDIGENLLETDEVGRQALPDNYILDFLTRHAAARESYLRLAPQLPQADQDRLAGLYRHALVATQKMDVKAATDRLQNNWNRAGVRTVGPRGGTRIGGN